MKDFMEIVISGLIIIGLLAFASVLAGTMCAIGYKVFLWVV